MSNMRHCPHCHCSTNSVKIGRVGSGKQRYKCKECNRTWVSKSHPQRLERLITHDYFIEDYRLTQLCYKYQLGKDKLRSILHSYQAPTIIPSGKHDVVCMDSTYFGRRGINEWGLLIIVDAHTGECLYCKEIPGHETYAHYLKALDELEGHGIKPKACVIDGVVGLAGVLTTRGILVQYCQFHQTKTIIQYLTRNPVLQPNIELKSLATSLKYASRSSFTAGFNQWFYSNKAWLAERTRNPDTGKLEYTHSRTRSAVNSIRRNYSYLFTYEQYPDLQIPNTNNLLEGINSAIKSKLNRHRGASKDLKIKIILTFLSRRTGV